MSSFYDWINFRGQYLVCRLDRMENNLNVGLNWRKTVSDILLSFSKLKNGQVLDPSLTFAFLRPFCDFFSSEIVESESMPRLPPKSSYPVIRLALHGCTNRPFFHIVLTRSRKPRDAPPKEQLGSYDPMPNIYNEKIVSLDIERIKFHLAKGVVVTKPVEKLLGLSGLLPVHPMSYITAKRNRQKLEAEKTESDLKSDQESIS